MPYYKIADITIQVSSDIPITDTTFGKKFQAFETEAPGDDMVSLHHRPGVPPVSRDTLGERVYCKGPWEIFRKGENWHYAGVVSVNDGFRPYQMARFSDDHTAGEIFHGPGTREAFLNGNLQSLTSFPTDQILLAPLLADRDAVIVHAAGVVMNGNGYLFVGHSEAGKTTTSRMFMDKGATLLCDDRIIVRKHKNGFRIHGTWSHGDIRMVSSASAPLRAVFFLEKSPVNVLLPMDDRFRSFYRLFPCLIKGLVTRRWLAQILPIAEVMITDIPFYRMLFDESGRIVDLITSSL